MGNSVRACARLRAAMAAVGDVRAALIAIRPAKLTTHTTLARVRCMAPRGATGRHISTLRSDQTKPPPQTGAPKLSFDGESGAASSRTRRERCAAPQGATFSYAPARNEANATHP